MATLLDYALTTVADVKELLGVSDASQDNLIIRKINQATEIIEGYCQRRFKETRYTDEEYDGTGIDELILRNRPVMDNTTLTVEARDTVLNEDDFSTTDAEEYFVDRSAGIITGVGRFYGGNARWRVSYRAGYATIPADVAEAAATLAAFLTDNPTGSGASSGIQSKREGQREIKYHAPNQQSSDSLINQLGLDETLDRYREPLISGQR